MAIYQEDEYKEVIRRVKQKIAELKIEIGATLSEEEISRLKNNAILDYPKHTACFLQEVGDGCDDMLTVSAQPFVRHRKKEFIFPVFIGRRMDLGSR